jgi:hypothetical protein
MALTVVGSGLGRTGTKSLQTALNMLGLGPCHHMMEVFTHPETMALWVEAGAGRPNWEAIFADYRSMVDYPGAAFWRQLADYYPDAKVLHSVRDPDQWFDSTQATIFAPGSPITKLGADGGPLAAFFDAFLGDLRPHLADRAYMTAHFRRHTEAVKAAIPAERLLVYEVGSGWEPLCAFFGLPIPETPYPSENNRAEFIARVQSGQFPVRAT